ncbi:alanine dehydrogenase [Acrasis kona]|uniref:Alanine dehydrogenase n=1 Tax=Acrasis kona TaxID=1008807 RepID=A0AAW2ZBR8_9EUKA
MRVLNKKNVDDALEYGGAIDAIEKAFVKFEEKKANVPARNVIRNDLGATLFMPARLESEESSSIGIKIVSVRSKNADKNLPTVPATVIIMDDVTGMTKAIMEGTELTCVRTASGSAVATKYLSREDSSVLSVFGCGNQGRAHVISICHVRQKINKVVLWNRTISKAHELAKYLIENKDDRWPFLFSDNTKSDSVDGKRVVRITVESDADAAANCADIICTTTDASKPFFTSDSVKPGTHLNCVGSYRLDMQEVESELVKKSKVVADDSEHVWSESGDVNTPKDQDLITKNHIICNVGKLVIDGPSGVRTNDQDITLYKSVGSAFMDIAVADLVVNNADRENIGQIVDF